MHINDLMARKELAEKLPALLDIPSDTRAAIEQYMLKSPLNAVQIIQTFERVVVNYHEPKDALLAVFARVRLDKTQSVPKRDEPTVVTFEFDYQKSIAMEIYLFLVQIARQGETATYESIALRFGLPSSGNQLGSVLSPILGRIFHFCKTTGQPYLTSIVVRKSGPDRGYPGSGFWRLYSDEDFASGYVRSETPILQEEVFNYWQML